MRKEIKTKTRTKRQMTLVYLNLETNFINRNNNKITIITKIKNSS